MSVGASLLVAGSLAALMGGWGAGRFLLRGPWHGLVRVLLVVGLSVVIFYAALGLGMGWEARETPADSSFGNALGDFAHNVTFGTLAGVQAALLTLCGWFVGLAVGLLLSRGKDGGAG